MCGIGLREITPPPEKKRRIGEEYTKEKVDKDDLEGICILHNMSSLEDKEELYKLLMDMIEEDKQKEGEIELEGKPMAKAVKSDVSKHQAHLWSNRMVEKLN